MGECLVPAPFSAPSAGRTRQRARRALGAVALLLGVVMAPADVALSQEDLVEEESDESVEPAPDAEDEELPPPIRLDVPSLPGDLDPDLGPGSEAPKTLPSGDLSRVRLADLIPSPELIHPDLPDGIVVDPTSLGPLASDLNAARANLVDARKRLTESRTQFDLASLRLAVIDDELDQAIEATQSTEIVRVEATDDLRGFAVSAFVGSEDLGALALSNDLDSMSLVTLADEASDHLSTTMLDATDEAQSAEADLTELRQERFVQVATQRASEEKRETAVADIAIAEEQIDTLGPELESSILQLEVQGTDMPLVVLDAYYTAAENFRVNRPSCRVSWHQLAGIGRVESVHGTFGGNVVERDGRTSGEILGPVLDGDPWLAIADTDGGEYDLDTEWDRAVGPMQFIPGSWARFGQDGNGDGIVDPHNLYDAAMAAAGHLCAANANLDQPANYQQALLGYNRSSAYGLLVMSYADGYFEALDLGPNL